MGAIIDIDHLSKEYGSGTKALDDVTLSIDEGEIIALLGPNGAGKTTLISIICGLVVPTGGTVRVGGHDIRTDWRAARKLIGLVPQEIALEPFEKVINCVRFTRGLYGMPPDEAYIERILRSLSLWDKRDAATRELSGGMKRRVLIAKALAHDPDLLFLDEPTAGVDVELRRDMWRQIDALRERGTTIILTTHYIEEAEEMADRVGVIDQGRILLVDDKAAMMTKLGRMEGRFTLAQPLASVPDALGALPLALEEDGSVLVYRGGDGQGQGRRQVAELAQTLTRMDIAFIGLETRQSSLEDIFVNLVERNEEHHTPIEEGAAA